MSFHSPQNGSNGKGKLADKKRVKAATQNAKRFYLILLVIGLAIGAVASIGVVALLRHWGLTDVPAQVEQE